MLSENLSSAEINEAKMLKAAQGIIISHDM